MVSWFVLVDFSAFADVWATALMKEIQMKDKLTSQATEKDLAKLEKKQKATGSAAVNLTMGTMRVLLSVGAVNACVWVVH